jgi:hypothetical protein
MRFAVCWNFSGVLEFYRNFGLFHARQKNGDKSCQLGQVAGRDKGKTKVRLSSAPTCMSHKITQNEIIKKYNYAASERPARTGFYQIDERGRFAAR